MFTYGGIVLDAVLDEVRSGKLIAYGYRVAIDDGLPHSGDAAGRVVERQGRVHNVVRRQATQEVDAATHEHIPKNNNQC